VQVCRASRLRTGSLDAYAFAAPLSSAEVDQVTGQGEAAAAIAVGTAAEPAASGSLFAWTRCWYPVVRLVPDLSLACTFLPSRVHGRCLSIFHTYRLLMGAHACSRLRRAQGPPIHPPTQLQTALDYLDPSKPHQTTILGYNLVAWRDSNATWRCFRDSCPHRAAPLSGAQNVHCARPNAAASLPPELCSVKVI
jgi:hypothetical protein